MSMLTNGNKPTKIEAAGPDRKDCFKNITLRDGLLQKPGCKSSYVEDVMPLAEVLLHHGLWAYFHTIATRVDDKNIRGSFSSSKKPRETSKISVALVTTL